MADVDQLLGRFVDEWAAGRRPDVDAYLAELPDRDERRAFSRGVEAYLATAPSPAYPEAVMADLVELPAVRAVAAGFGAGGPARALAEARVARGLSIRDLATRVADALGLPGREDKVAFYLDGLEDGTIPPQPVRRPAWEGIARVLDVAVERFVVPLPPLASAAPALMRDFSEEVDASLEAAVMAEELLADASPGAWDEVDELFRG